MKIFVTVKPGSKKEYIKQIDRQNFIVAVHEVPVDDKANQAILRALAKFLKIKSYSLCIVSGRTSRKKIVEVLE